MKKIYTRITLCAFDFYTWLTRFWQIRIRQLDKLIATEVQGSALLPESTARVAIVAISSSPFNLSLILNLLRGLQCHGFFIIVVSDRPIHPSLRDTLTHNCHQIIERTGIGADFASYRAGWNWLTKNKGNFLDLDVLIMANDSLFYPRNIDATISDMIENGAAWQCLFQSFEIAPHAQSCFLFFRRPVFTSNAFHAFWVQYREQTVLNGRATKGEIALSVKLARAGFDIHTYYSSSGLVRTLTATPQPLDLLELGALSPVTKSSPVGREEIFRAAASIFTEHRCFSDGHKNEACKLIFRKFAHMIGHQFETGNPTHVAGLLLNNLFGAPLKRDTCFRGAYDIFQILRFASGYDEAELISMHEDLSARALPVSSTGLKKLLIDNGRI